MVSKERKTSLNEPIQSGPVIIAMGWHSCASTRASKQASNRCFNLNLHLHVQTLEGGSTDATEMDKHNPRGSAEANSVGPIHPAGAGKPVNRKGLGSDPTYLVPFGFSVPKEDHSLLRSNLGIRLHLLGIVLKTDGGDGGGSNRTERINQSGTGRSLVVTPRTGRKQSHSRPWLTRAQREDHPAEEYRPLADGCLEFHHHDRWRARRTATRERIGGEIGKQRLMTPRKPPPVMHREMYRG